MSDFKPRRLGQYILTGTLGQGGMGAVHAGLARSVSGRWDIVAVKTASMERRTELEREAALLAKIKSPHIEEFKSLGVENGEFFFAKELLRGQSLFAFLKSLREDAIVLPTEFSCAIGASIALALDHMHQLADPELGGANQLMHGDLNPTNVMITWQGEVKLIDLGLAHFAKRAFSPSVEVDWGTVRYSSPDRILHHRLSVTDDLFALGMILWEMAAGKGYWGSMPNDAVAAALHDFKPKDVREANAAVPEHLALIIDRCLSADGFRGYHEAIELRQDLIPHAMLTAKLRDFVQRHFATERLRAIEQEGAWIAIAAQFVSTAPPPAKETVPAPQASPVADDAEEPSDIRIQSRGKIYSRRAVAGVRAVAICEAVILALGLSFVPQLRSLPSTSGTWRTLYYVNRLVLTTSGDFISSLWLESQIKGGMAPQEQRATLNIHATPPVDSVELEFETVGGRGTTAVAVTGDQFALLTLKRNGFADLHILIDRTTRNISADFAARKIH